MGLIEKCIPHTKKNNNDRTILQIIQHSHDGDHVYLFSPLSLSLIHIAIMWSTLCPIWGVVFTAVVVGHGLLTLGGLVFLSILGFSLLLTHFLFWNRRVRPGKTLNCAGWVGGGSFTRSPRDENMRFRGCKHQKAIYTYTQIRIDL